MNAMKVWRLHIVDTSVSFLLPAKSERDESIASSVDDVDEERDTSDKSNPVPEVVTAMDSTNEESKWSRGGGDITYMKRKANMKCCTLSIQRLWKHTLW
tara:strand:+ start:368 stop:664 length:297 start_codon:yes stop_codon:yes gene_type:complete